MGYNPFDYIGKDKRKSIGKDAITMAQGVVESKLREVIRKVLKTKLSEKTVRLSTSRDADFHGNILQLIGKKHKMGLDKKSARALFKAISQYMRMTFEQTKLVEGKSMRLPNGIKIKLGMSSLILIDARGKIVLDRKEIERLGAAAAKYMGIRENQDPCDEEGYEAKSFDDPAKPLNVTEDDEDDDKDKEVLHGMKEGGPGSGPGGGNGDDDNPFDREPSDDELSDIEKQFEGKLTEDVYAIVDKFNQKKQDYDQVYFKDKNLNKVKKHLKKMGSKYGKMNLIKVKTNGKMSVVEGKLSEKVQWKKDKKIKGKWYTNQGTHKHQMKANVIAGREWSMGRSRDYDTIVVKEPKGYTIYVRPLKEGKLTEAEIWFNPKELEPYLKKIGLDFPKYPKQGDVLYKGKKVGHMSNFNGFQVYSKSLLKQLQKVERKYKLGIWNPTSGLTMEGKLTESDLPITTKKGKTITLTHETSGKEIVVVNNERVLKKYLRLGFLPGLSKWNEVKLSEAVRFSDKQVKQLQKAFKNVRGVLPKDNPVVKQMTTLLKKTDKESLQKIIDADITNLSDIAKRILG